MLPVAFEFTTHYRTRDGSPISVIFACGPNIAVNATVGLPFLTSTGSILDKNDNILDMTKVNECPFPIDFCSPSNSTPVTGTHTDKVDKEQYGKSLKDLDKVEAHVYKSLSKLTAIYLQSGKKLRFAKNINVAGTKCIKLNEKPNTTSTETLMVVFHDSQAGVPNIGTQLPEFATVIPTGDLPSVENCTGYCFGESSDTGGKK